MVDDGSRMVFPEIFAEFRNTSQIGAWCGVGKSVARDSGAQFRAQPASTMSYLEQHRLNCEPPAVCYTTQFTELRYAHNSVSGQSNDWGSRGRRFKSCRPDLHFLTTLSLGQKHNLRLNLQPQNRLRQRPLSAPADSLHLDTVL